MATISAVLYANTEHANLKESYPNWTDRCKQILKRWRSLCNEKKAPFLQKAKDNRSALRQRREQCKVTQPTKLEKQDDGRSWKHQPCKPKEDQSNLFGNNNKCKYILIVLILNLNKSVKQKSVIENIATVCYDTFCSISKYYNFVFIQVGSPTKHLAILDQSPIHINKW